MEALEKTYRVLERIARWAVWIGGFALLLSAFMITIEVIGRKLGGTEVLGVALPQFRVPGSDEYSGYVFAGATTWAYSYCLIHRSHIRIDALYNIFPVGLRAVLDIVGLSLLLLYMGYLTKQGFFVFSETWENDSVSNTTQRTPLLIPQLAWFSGLVFFNITLVILIAYSVVSLFVAGPRAVQKIAGTMSVDEEVAESTHGVREIQS